MQKLSATLKLFNHHLRHQLKEYIRTSRAQVYVKKFKQLLEKIQTRCKEVEKIRNSEGIDLRDLEAMVSRDYTFLRWQICSLHVDNIDSLNFFC